MTLRPLNPLTSLALAATAWMGVLGFNHPWVSGVVVVVACLLGWWRSGGPQVALMTATLALPVGLSMLLIHSTYGETALWWRFHLEGLQLAGALTLRAAALIATVLAALSSVSVPELAKALQATRLPSSLVYVVCGALQLIPEARTRIAAIRDAQFLRGVSTRGPKATATAVAIPLMTQLLTASADRADAVTLHGIGLQTRRTVLRPVPDSRIEQVLRIALPVTMVVVVILWS